MQKKGKMKRALSMAITGILATGCLATAVQAAEHTHSLKADLVIAPTCQTEGFTVYVCEELGCGYSVKDDFTAVASHTEESIPGIPATCTTTGLTDGMKCSVCGEELLAQTEIPAAHTLKAGLVVDPTCQVGGYTVYECEVTGCGYSVKDDFTDKVAHTEETVPGTAATCTATGLTDETKCSVCGEILEAQKAIPAVGHKLTFVDAKEATETAEGNKAHYVCSVCGKLYEDATGLVEIAMEAIKIPIVQPTVPSTPVVPSIPETEPNTEIETETEVETEEETEEESSSKTSGAADQNSANKNSGQTAFSNTAPATGDNTLVTLYFSMFLLSGAGILLILRKMWAVR